MSYVEMEITGDWIDDVNSDPCSRDDETPEWEREGERVELPDCDEPFDESMDGDHESALASVGWGTDEDYGCYGDDPYDCW